MEGQPRAPPLPRGIRRMTDRPHNVPTGRTRRAAAPAPAATPAAPAAPPPAQPEPQAPPQGNQRAPTAEGRGSRGGGGGHGRGHGAGRPPSGPSQNGAPPANPRQQQPPAAFDEDAICDTLRKVNDAEDRFGVEQALAVLLSTEQRSLNHRNYIAAIEHFESLRKRTQRSLWQFLSTFKSIEDTVVHSRAKQVLTPALNGLFTQPILSSYDMDESDSDSEGESANVKKIIGRVLDNCLLFVERSQLQHLEPDALKLLKRSSQLSDATRDAVKAASTAKKRSQNAAAAVAVTAMDNTVLHGDRFKQDPQRRADYKDTLIVPSPGDLMSQLPLPVSTTEGPLDDLDVHKDTLFHHRRTAVLSGFQVSVELLRKHLGEGISLKDAVEKVNLPAFVARVLAPVVGETSLLLTDFVFQDRPTKTDWIRAKTLSASNTVLVAEVAGTTVTPVAVGFIAVPTRDHEDDDDILHNQRRDAGRVAVRFPDKPDVMHKQLPTPRPTYVIIDSSMLWEGFVLALEALKRCDIPVDFQEIIKCTPGAFNDLLLPGAVEIEGDNDRTWRVPPAAVEFATEKHFDPAQRDAFYHQLSSRVGIVQGPPGTGKSYVGTSVVEYFLRHTSEKVLLMTFSNHALDTCCLSLIDNMEEEAKPGVLVRLGSRCNDERLKKYVLRGNGMNVDRRAYMDTFKKIKAITDVMEQDSLPSAEEVSSDRQVWPQELDHVLRYLRDEMERLYKAAATALQEALKASSIVDAEKRKDKGSKRYLKELQQLQREKRGAHREAALRLRWFIANKTGRENRRAVASYDFSELVQPPALPQGRLNPGSLTRQQWKTVWEYIRFHLREGVTVKVANLRLQFESLGEARRKSLFVQDSDILRKARVIAATTSGAMRRHLALASADRSVLVFEEAAEIHEGDVLGCLVPTAKRVLLLGDHQQLQPKLRADASTNLEKVGALVSIMERFVKNKAQFVTLAEQRRMHPDISVLTAWMYRKTLAEQGRELTDSPSVTAPGARPPVSGVDGRVVFVDHGRKERTTASTRSYKNADEAAFAVGLAAHLIRTGAEPSAITIVTGYRDQTLEISRKLSAAISKVPEQTDEDGIPWTEKVCVSTIDNYQGEENDIVIVSLVRSSKTGFVKLSNRALVVLSRARRAMFVVGNLPIFEKTPVWETVLRMARERNCVSGALQLTCPVHGGSTAVSVGEVFPPPCPVECGKQRPCGHKCRQKCHGDRPCADFKCPKPCVRQCRAGVHRSCTQDCHADDVECDPCNILVRHDTGCGKNHVLTVLCDEIPPHCTERLPQALPCGHDGFVVCGTGECLPCEAKCGGMLLCDHKCESLCRECRPVSHPPLLPVHRRCKRKCDRPLPCGHICQEKCSSVCPPCDQQCNRQCKHSKCEHSCATECIACVEPCEMRCPHHRCNALCCEVCDVPPCSEPCPKTLPCGHKCPGLCGEPCPERACFQCGDRAKHYFMPHCEEAASDPEGRFITVCPANHIGLVDEVDSMMRAWEEDFDLSDKVMFPQCPMCREIVTTPRYSAILRRARERLDRAKFAAKETVDETEAVRTKAMGDLTNATGNANYLCEQHENAGEDDTNPSAAWRALIRWVAIVEDFNKQVKSQHSRRHISLGKIAATRARHLSNVATFVLFPCSPHAVNYDERLANSDDLKDAINRFLTNCEEHAAEAAESPTTAMMADATNVLIKAIRVVPPARAPEYQHGDTIESRHRAALTTFVNILDGDRRAAQDAVRELAAVGAIRERGAMHVHRCGYVYAIGDCGGAIVDAQCPRCGGRLGGADHRRAEGNRVTGEFDGATEADRNRWD